MTETDCGDRRCTLREAETELELYSRRFGDLEAEHRAKAVDDLDPRMTRIKTELDEFRELVDNAKQKGADAWDNFQGRIEKSMSKLGQAFKSDSAE